MVRFSLRSLIYKCDIILEVLDARFPYIFGAVPSNKEHWLILNKVDLCDDNQLKRLKGKIKGKAFYISVKKKWGIAMLRRELNKLQGTVGIIGVPNTGKSSLINLLKGRHSAGVSPMAGFTRGVQNLRMTANLMLIDSPGIIPKEDEDKLALINAINPHKVKDPVTAAIRILNRNTDEVLEHYYKIDAKPREDLLERIAIKRCKLKKGGIPDELTMAKIVIDEHQRGKIK